MSDVAVIEKPKGAPPATPVAPVRPPKPRDLTVEEELKLRTYYAMCDKGQRFLVLAAFEGNAWKAYNKQSGKDGPKVANFEEYCKTVLSLPHDKSYLSRLVSTARVERAIAGESFNVLKLTSGEDTAEPEVFKPRLTVRAAEAISKLPEDKWQGVYEEAVGKPGETTPGELTSNITRIAGREYRVLHPEAAKPGRKAGAVVTRKSTPPDAAVNTAGVEGLDKPKRDMTPVRGETYDGSPEQKFIEAGGTAEEWKAQQELEAAAEGATVAPGDTEGASEYQRALEEVHNENVALRSFLKTFLSLMEMKDLDVAALHTLYNDGTEWAKAHSL